MTAALALLLLAQERPGADVLRQLDALFALPSLVSARPAYLSARAEGDFTLTLWEGVRGVGFGKGSNVYARAYHVDLDVDGRLWSFSAPSDLGHLPRNDPDEPAPETVFAASGFVRELTGEDRELEPDFAMIDENGVRSVSFLTYRRVEGRPVIERGSAVDVIVRDGVRLQSFGRAPRTEEIDAETYGHDRTLPLDRLREIARGRLRVAKLSFGFAFAQYRLETDRVEIALPNARAPRNAALAERRVGIPIYRRTEFAPSEPGGDATIEVSLDARTGTLLDLWAGRGRMGWGRAIPVPGNLTYAGVTGALEPLSMRSATPPRSARRASRRAQRLRRPVRTGAGHPVDLARGARAVPGVPTLGGARAAAPGERGTGRIDSPLCRTHRPRPGRARCSPSPTRPGSASSRGGSRGSATSC